MSSLWSGRLLDVADQRGDDFILQAVLQAAVGVDGEIGTRGDVRTGVIDAGDDAAAEGQRFLVARFDDVGPGLAPQLMNGGIDDVGADAGFGRAVEWPDAGGQTAGMLEQTGGRIVAAPAVLAPFEDGNGFSTSCCPPPPRALLAPVEQPDGRPCVDALEAALLKYDSPEIMNTDQGSQFTRSVFIGVLQEQEIQISMDGKGGRRDSVFVEQFWKSLKYEEVYLYGYGSLGKTGS